MFNVQRSGPVRIGRLSRSVMSDAIWTQPMGPKPITRTLRPVPRSTSFSEPICDNRALIRRNQTMQLTVSPPAAEALKQVIQEHGTLGSPAAVRIGVQGACGCGNAHFGMMLDEKKDGDTLVEIEGVNF